MGYTNKSNLLDEVLKMYKQAAGDYSEYQGNNMGAFSSRDISGEYEVLGNPGSLEQTTLADTNTKYTKITQAGRTIKSPQPIHKRLYSPPVKIGGPKIYLFSFVNSSFHVRFRVVYL